ncbi:MAG: DUF5916 domain-containing protein, partial [Bacteroidota bacterium]
LDFTHQWADRNWYLGANLVMSEVHGSTKSIQQTQLSVPHLFQRPDARHSRLDTLRTFLHGTGGDVKIGKAGQGHLQFETGLTWRSPGLALNDIGFMREADLIQQYLGVTYRSINSFGAFRNARVGYKHWINGDFGGNLNYIDWDVEVNATLQNNWSGTFGFFNQPHIYAKSLLQGGPRLRLTDQYGVWWAANSDSRQQLFVSYSGWTKTGGPGSYYLLSNSLEVVWQPLDRFNLSLSPTFTDIQHRLQYNATVNFEGKPRYITSMLDQQTFGIPIRLNLVLNPNLAIQYYGEPFITTGRYDDFNFVKNPLMPFGPEQLAFFNSEQLSLYNGQYQVDEQVNGQTDYSFQNPDFSFAQFRSNLVLRFEYKPGSEIFLVWSQGLQDTQPVAEPWATGIRNQLLGNQPQNTFLIKVTHRFHR